MKSSKNIFKIILSFCLLSILIGCASTDHKPTFTQANTDKEGQWECKAQLKNLTKNESHVVNLDVYAIRHHNLRMEATGPLGIRLASILMIEQQFSAIEYTQQKAYLGSAKSKSFASVLKIPVDPKWFYNIFFDEALPGPEWQCSYDKNNMIKECNNNQAQFKIQWLDRIEDNKRIVISNPQFQLNIITKEHQPKVENPDKVFNLKIPENYSKIQI